MSAASSVGQRFSQLIQALGMSKNAFAISLDKTATVIQHLVDERNKPGFDLMNKVVDVYPNVSLDWLMRGKGPMMLNGAGAPTAAEGSAPDVAIAPVASKPASATPNFPTPLFAVVAARQPAPVAPLLSAKIPAAEPAATATAAAPEAIVQEAPLAAANQPPAPMPVAPAATVPPEPSPAVSAAQMPPAGLTTTIAGPAAAPAPDAAYITAALHAQHLQHQLALAEQRNQHLLEQQKLILERQALMQQMLDFMRRPV